MYRTTTTGQASDTANDTVLYYPICRHPFRSPAGDLVTSRDMVDTVNQLGIDYSLGSFDKVWLLDRLCA